jgi:hypothetical protein
MNARRAIAATALLAACGCASTGRTPAMPRRSAQEFLAAATLPFPTESDDGRLVVVSPGADRVAIYDNALAVLLDVRLGRRDDAERILSTLARLQRSDGSLVFSFDRHGAKDAPPYVRSGALAWVGFAAVAYLDASRDGGGREAIARMAHELARYLLAHQVRSEGDPRDGLVTGGEGNLLYDVAGGKVRETFTPGEIGWASTEHNIDAYFFLRALGRVAARADYVEAAARIRQALVARLWNAEAGQMNRGVDAHGGDDVLALDCASWGALFFLAAAEPKRAETSFAVADGRYTARAGPPNAAAVGHRPYARGPLVASRVLEETYVLPAHDWETARAVWPEGSAGVALAALRLGNKERAEAILAGVEPLRDASGGLPTLTIEVPLEFDRAPSVAGTAWVELVREEIARPGVTAVLWGEALRTEGKR